MSINISIGSRVWFVSYVDDCDMWMANADDAAIIADSLDELLKRIQ